MKKQKIKELRLTVGTSPAYMPATGKGNPVGTVFNTNADDVFSKRYSLVNEEESEEEEEMPENILEYRVYRHGQYQLLETLERIDEGFLQKIADLAKSIPGLDTVVGNVELYLQSANVKDAFDGLGSIISSLKHAAGLSAMAIIGTAEQYSDLLHKFILSNEEDKSLLREGVEKLLEILKQMTITAAQTFDSVVALPTFAAAGVGGVVGETITNLVTSLGTFLRDQPVEQFVFKTLSERSGIIAKVVELFEKVLSMITGGGAIGKALGFVVDKISSTGGAIVELFLTKPFELLRRLGDLYKAAIGEPVENIELANPNLLDVDNSAIEYETDMSSVYESKRYSLLSLIEALDESPPSTDKYDDDPALKGGQKKLPDALQKGIISKANKKKKNETKDEEESFKEIDLEEFSSLGAGSIGGYTGPLGDEKRRNISKAEYLQKEQIERMRILESYHQKTSNKLK